MVSTRIFFAHLCPGNLQGREKSLPTMGVAPRSPPGDTSTLPSSLCSPDTGDELGTEGRTWFRVPAVSGRKFPGAVKRETGPVTLLTSGS